MGKLLRKEFKLCMHPSVYIMFIMSFMVTIPNYPYLITFFYITLSVFMLCQLGRENHDVVYSMTLPVGKRDIVRGRILFVCILELAQVVIVLLLSVLTRNADKPENLAGMEANLALIAEGLILFGVFNLTFFTRYYKDVSKVGFSYFIAAVVFMVMFVVMMFAEHTVPVIRDCLDTPDPMYIKEKLVALLIGAVIYVLLTKLAVSISVKRFEKQDIK